MNKIYKVLKNSKGISLAVSELAKGRGKKTKSILISATVASALSVLMAGNASAVRVNIDTNQTIKGDNTGTIASGQDTKDEYFIGQNGHLTISDNGKLSMGRIMVGHVDGSTGQLTLDNGHLINTFGDPYFGAEGNANVLITNGGTFTNAGWAVLRVASGVNSNVNLTVTGKGSELNQVKSQDMSIASNGNAVVNVLDGGVINSTRGTFVGHENGKGIINISGKGSAFNTGGMRVGALSADKTGYGEINITNGGAMNVSDGDWGLYKKLAIRNGKVLVDGKDSKLNVMTELVVNQGGNHSSSLTVSNDAVVKTQKGDQSGEDLGITIDKNGVVNIGGEAGKAAEKAGTIDTSKVGLNDGGKLNINHTNTDYDITWDIAGKGDVNVTSGDNLISGHHSYEGKTNITGGSWTAKGENVFSPNSDYNIGKDGSLNLNDHNQTIGSVVNGGTIDLGKNSPDTTLTVNGDYHGDNGKLNIYMDTENGKTDKMVVTGNVTGTTNIDINEIGNGKANNGTINVIEVGGTDGGKWNVVEKADSEFDYTIGRDKDGKLTIEYTNVLSSVTNSPVVASIFGNQLAALNMFRHSAHDRDTSIYVPDSNVWMRYNYDRTKTDLFNGKQSLDMKTSMIEMGVDVLSLDQFKAGVYGGYGHSTIDTKQKHSRRKGDGSVTGYNLGVYGNWNAQTNGEGLFVDTWAQYSWFKHKTSVHLSNIRNYSSKYDGDAVSLSAEVGYGMVMLEGDERNWLLEPHAQVGYTWLNSDKFTFGRAGDVDDINADGAQLRLGARYYGQSTKSGFGVLPFIEANWLYDSSAPEAKVKGKNVESNLGKNFAEVKVGVNGNFTNSLSGYAQLDTRFGSDKYSHIGGQLGINYSF
ncbi:autotransporter outer membrane beta-barrel domain-containing protein [Gilliamella sp. ESL0443]|uniref:autotransporter outer membrane beta-barrel domain-containing protein n=1 Tax=Gilliamella sp. ESL0443 TaxID=2704655 RepID=UPI001C6974FF|nr:autotransporter outer membrane beta-barrel domain-containing protein [Gilliamella sp. ESL0443]QYN42299.1 autotransporter outer membrane beta-barrel domain-containing protein [Gilliamella sp. ESL0443]